MDQSGNLWQADASFAGGARWDQTNQPGLAALDIPYRSLRYSDGATPFSYGLQLQTGQCSVPGQCSVTLHMVEPNKTGPGMRIFSVSVNNAPAITDLDLFNTSGLMKASDATFPVVSSDGKISIVFTASVGNAVISGIQIDWTPTPLVLDVFRTGNQQSFKLSHTPSSDAVLVFLNGLLMLAGEDYTLSGVSLTFTGQVIGDGPIIQVRYSAAN